MIPILYEKTETKFLTEGLGRLSDCISCTVTEERNGIFECELEYPITGAHYEDIQEGRIIYAAHDETGDPQPFDIYAHTKPINGVVTFYAHHISYRLGEITVRPFTEGSCAGAVAAIPQMSINANPFTFWTDKSTAGTFKVEVPTASRALLCGTEGSLLDVYGTGEYEFDKFTVKLHLHRGTDTGVAIRYGKNLIDLTEETDYQDTYNAVVPYWYGSAGEGDTEEEILVTLPEWAISSGHSSYNGRVVLVPMDLSGAWQEPPTEDQLRDKATALIADREGWLPSQNVKVDFVALWQTEEYAQYAPLQRVRLCDTVSVYYPELGVDAAQKKVVKVVYNTLLDRYDSIELGSLSSTLVGMINGNVEDELDALRASIDNHDVAFEQVMAAAIQNATDLITGGLGGHVVLKQNAAGQPEEILIMNTDDINTATKVWRWNLGGLGYSSTGYSGTYGTAITMDGSIVADFITTGVLNANIIRAGVLSDLNGYTTFNLSTGVLTMKKGEINLGSGAFKVTDAGILTMTKGSISLGSGAFSVTDQGTLTMTKGSINIGSGAFSVTDQGVLTMTKGSISLGSGAFSVTDQGTLTMTKGSINLGSGAFKVTDAGVLTMTKGSISLGTPTKFAVSSSGALTCSDATITGGSLTIGDYFEVTPTGELYAEAGYIGPWEISSTGLEVYSGSYNSCLNQNEIRIGTNNSGFSYFWAGNGYSGMTTGNVAGRFLINMENSSLDLGKITDTSGSYLAALTIHTNYMELMSPTSSSPGSIKLTSDGLTLITGRQNSHSGNLYITGSGTAYYGVEGSSRKIKKDVAPIEKDELDPKRLYDVEVIQFKYKDEILDETDPLYNVDQPGFIVEDLEKIYPVVIEKDPEDPEESKNWSWSMRRIIPSMLKLIQDQHKDIEELKRRLS